MIDIHCHLIYGVDDGPASIKESMRMVLEAERLGIRTIIATPHYNKGIYDSYNVKNHFRDIKSRIYGCGIELLLGYEVFVDSMIPDCIENPKKFCLGGSNYLLFELPFDIMLKNIDEKLLQLHLNDIIPVIAHPERNRYFIRYFDRFVDLIESGLMVQVDAASIAGVYGRDVQEFTKKIIKKNLVDFVASDAHCSNDYIDWYAKSYKNVHKWAGAECANRLFSENPKKLI